MALEVTLGIGALLEFCRRFVSSLTLSFVALSFHGLHVQSAFGCRL